MAYLDFNLLREAIPLLTNNDMSQIINKGILYPNDRLAIWGGAYSTNPRAYDDIYDRYRRIENQNLKWNGYAPVDTNNPKIKEGIRRVYAMNVNDGGQPLNIPKLPFTYDDPYIKNMEHDYYTQGAMEKIYNTDNPTSSSNLMNRYNNAKISPKKNN